METTSADHRTSALSVVGSKPDYEEIPGSSISLDDVVVDGGDVEDCLDELDTVAREAALAVDSGVHAELITSGSSGSYYIRDRQKVHVISNSI